MLSNEERKILYFEYILKRLLQWYAEYNQKESPNDFSILKSLKLLFFVAASSSHMQARKSRLLNEIFNDFVAMPYGHVESNLYDILKRRKGDLNFFTITNKELTSKDQSNLGLALGGVDQEILAEIDAAIAYLKKLNPRLVLLSPFDLVNLSHAWHSWKSYYNRALLNSSQSERIPVSIIESEDKVFNLEIFS